MEPEVYLYMLYSNAIYPPRKIISCFLRLDRTTTTTTLLVPRLLEPPPHRLDHPPEPIEVQHAQRRVADHVRRGEPRRHRQATSRRLECGPDVLVHTHALVGAPEQAAGGEGGDEGDAVDELGGGARHAELIHEPVDVEEGGRELVQDEV